LKPGNSGPQWVIGWREWISLPDLGVAEIKAKIDTGARSSALHAYGVERFRRRGKDLVRFGIHPIQRNDRRVVLAEAELVDERNIRDSGGHVERRPVIRTAARLSGRLWKIDVTLTNRDEMGFRMLLGRRALVKRFLVDPARSFLAGRPVHADLNSPTGDGPKGGVE
jgi:hypothetical protein